MTNFDAVTDGSGNLGSKIAVCDGSALANCAAVKAPATAPLATDPATVVAISPNGFPVDQATFTPGTSPGSLINCEYQSTFTSNPIGTGHQGTVGCNNYRGVFANLMNSSGSEIGIVASPLYIAAPPSSSAAVAITPVSSTTAESSHILKGSAGNLYSVYVTTGATLGYLMAFNATSAPADGAVTPVDCIPVAANSTASLASNGAPPTAFSIGITVVSPRPDALPRRRVLLLSLGERYSDNQTSNQYHNRCPNTFLASNRTTNHRLATTSSPQYSWQGGRRRGRECANHRSRFDRVDRLWAFQLRNLTQRLTVPSATGRITRYRARSASLPYPRSQPTPTPSAQRHTRGSRTAPGRRSRCRCGSLWQPRQVRPRSTWIRRCKCLLGRPLPVRSYRLDRRRPSHRYRTHRRSRAPLRAARSPRAQRRSR